MRVDLFDFSLPQHCIATQPAEPRDSARLLEIGAQLADRVISELPALLRPGDMLVFNDSKVIPARLFGKRGEAKIELLLHKPCSDIAGHWLCFARPAKRLQARDVITLAQGWQARVLEKLGDGQVRLDFGCDNDSLYQKLEQHGHMPLPPYMQRDDTPADKTRYQTVYARKPGSVAAPTAGLHFTDRLLAALETQGIGKAWVTLQVGGGTFLPVKVEDTTQHVMHSEWASVSQATAEAVNAAKAAGGRIIAVGTTSLRTLESATDAQGKLQVFDKETDIFITPGYRFKLVDGLLTNFHLPKSTLFMLVSAFSGRERMQAAYAHAISAGYRFYSYGDACLLWPEK